MKKDILLKLIALILLGITLNSILANEEECVDCETCCKQGRWASSECCRNCNGCEMYSDQSTQECRDIPY